MYSDVYYFKTIKNRQTNTFFIYRNNKLFVYRNNARVFGFLSHRRAIFINFNQGTYTKVHSPLFYKGEETSYALLILYIICMTTTCSCYQQITSG
jgi:hypothetical protein